MSLYEMLKAAVVKASLANPGSTDHAIARRLLASMGVTDPACEAEEHRRRKADPMRAWVR